MCRQTIQKDVRGLSLTAAVMVETKQNQMSEGRDYAKSEALTL